MRKSSVPAAIRNVGPVLLSLVALGCAEGLTGLQEDGGATDSGSGAPDGTASDATPDAPEAPRCDNQRQDGDETGVDCGGHCDPCLPGAGCAVPEDCTSGVCTGGECKAPSCSDGVKNGTETDQDCGGSCPGCANGGRCMQNQDCETGTCDGGFCGTAQTCDDGFQNQNETDVDCGGVCAPGKRCAQGGGCAVDADCVTNTCREGSCTTQCTPVASCTCGTRMGVNYLFCAVNRQWSEAASDCIVRNMRLVRIDSAQENDWVRSSANGAGLGVAWIGASDQATEGTFTWPDGSVFWVSGTTQSGFYANWGSGEPNDFFGQDCGSMTTSGAWDDEGCTSSRHYICKEY